MVGNPEARCRHCLNWWFLHSPKSLSYSTLSRLPPSFLDCLPAVLDFTWMFPNHALHVVHLNLACLPASQFLLGEVSSLRPSDRICGLPVPRLLIGSTSNPLPSAPQNHNQPLASSLTTLLPIFRSITHYLPCPSTCILFPGRSPHLSPAAFSN